MLDDWPLGEQRPDSEFEVAIARFLRNHRLHGFVFHPLIEGLEVDFACAARRLVLEGDGWEYHSSRASFERDRWRDLILTAGGWRVVRLTWRRLSDEPDRVADLLRRAVDAG